MRKLFPEISVVTRQSPNIKRRIMKNKYSRKEVNPSTAVPPPGNYRQHAPARCVCCARMEDDLRKVKITKTGREYMVKRHYTCLSTNVVYLVTCQICWSQYVGQTTQELRKRHYGHRDEVKRHSDGVGEHFHAHAVELGLDLKSSKDMEALMKSFHLAVVGSVQPDQPWSQARLDSLESDLQHWFQCMDKHGGMGKRDETKRRRNGQ